MRAAGISLDGSRAKWYKAIILRKLCAFSPGLPVADPDLLVSVWHGLRRVQVDLFRISGKRALFLFCRSCGLVGCGIVGDLLLWLIVIVNSTPQ
jgi:hypothetical protein